MMKPLQIDNLPPDILTGEFEFEYERLASHAAAEVIYKTKRLLMLKHVQDGVIAVKYERIGPEPLDQEKLEILERLKGIEKTLLDALEVTK